jgi:hypothetical protein
MPGGLEVGRIYTVAGVRVDDDGFNRYERRVDAVRRDARHPITAHAKADVDERGFRRYGQNIERADRDTHRFSTRVAGYFGGIRVAAFGMATAGAAAAGLLGRSFVNSASDVNESLSKNRVLFGKYADDVAKFSDTSAKSFGISKVAALDATGTFGNLFRALDIGPKKAADLSVNLTQLAADMASFNNASPEDTLEALRSGLVGETEPLRRFGVNINDAQLREEALRQGLIKSTKDVLPANVKALAAVALITKQTSAAHGDFARTSGGLANQSRILKAQISDLGANIGARLLPVVLKVTTFLNDLIGGRGKGMSGVGEKARDVGSTVRTVLTGAFRVAGDAARYVGRIIDDNRDTLESIGRTILGVARAFLRAGGQMVDTIRDTFGGRSSTGRDIRTIISRLLDVVDVVLKVESAVVKRALPGIVTAFRGLALIIRGIVRIIAGILSGDFGKAWDGVKDIFRGAVKLLAGILRAGTAPLRTAAGAIGSVIGGALSKAWDKALGVARGFVNGVIDVINIIPGINIKHIGGGSPSGPTDSLSRGATGGARRAGQFREGGKVTMPVAIMGEEAPEHPEWVIPTNPAYRQRAVGLWMAAARELGIPGFLFGGRFNPAKALDFVTDLPGKAVRGAAGIVSKLVPRLPHNPGGLLEGTFDWLLDKAKDTIGDAASGLWSASRSALSAVTGGGASSSSGLVPQVMRALAYARAHGWGGSVSSGFRDRSKQQYLWDHASELGLIRGVSVAAPGSSEHERGRAVDVTDWQTFRQIMAGAPAGSRLLWRGPTDVVHFSVSGHRRGGRLGIDGEHLGGGTYAYKAGGRTKARKPPPPVLSRKDNRGIARSVARAGKGIGAFETSIQGMERSYDQADRRFGLSDEVFLIENDDGSVTVDEGAIRAREGELGDLEERRRAIKKKIKDYRAAIRKLLKALRAARARVERALGRAKGKARAKERAGYREAIRGYNERIGDLKGTYRDLGFDLTDQAIDLEELAGERAEVSGNRSGGREPDPVEPPADSGGDSGTDSGAGDAPAPAPPTAEDIAAGVAQAFATFQAGRADLFSTFGQNFARAGSSPFATPTGLAAGTRFYGAAPGGGGIVAGAGGGVVQYITFTGPQPADPHLFAQATMHELKAAA